MIDRKIITLTTDFKTQDGYVGAMKGKILSICPEASIVDITHEITPQNILVASWAIFRSIPQFPEGSIHVVVVDPGVGSERKPVLIKSAGKWLIGPDNGIFSEIIRELGTEEIYQIKRNTQWWQSHASFDGLALFSPVAAHLALGLTVSEIGEPITSTLAILPKPAPEKGDNQVKGRVRLFDRFGNGITNITRESLSHLTTSSFKIQVGVADFQFVNHYAEGAHLQPVALFNSDGYLELSVFCGSAQSQLKLRPGAEVLVHG